MGPLTSHFTDGETESCRRAELGCALASPINDMWPEPSSPALQSSPFPSTSCSLLPAPLPSSLSSNFPLPSLTPPLPLLSHPSHSLAGSLWMLLQGACPSLGTPPSVPATWLLPQKVFRMGLVLCLLPPFAQQHRAATSPQPPPPRRLLFQTQLRTHTEKQGPPGSPTRADWFLQTRADMRT